MLRTGLLILAIPSIALLFLPYTFGVSPWATVSSGRFLGIVFNAEAFRKAPIESVKSLYPCVWEEANLDA